jgi:hypothetical protein
LIAPAIWFAHFTLLYAAEAFGCVLSASDRGSMIVWTALVATVAAWVSLGILLRGSLASRVQTLPASRDESTWLKRISMLLTFLSALGIFWTAFPISVLTPCVDPGLGGAAVEARAREVRSTADSGPAVPFEPLRRRANTGLGRCDHLIDFAPYGECTADQAT